MSIVLSGWWATGNGQGTNPSGPLWADNNIWGVDTNTTTFTQTITLPSGFPNGTVMNWSYPEIFAPSGKYSYPEIIYGATPYTTLAVGVPGGSTQLANLTNLTSTYNITLGGETGHYDVIWDAWFTSQPNGGASDRQFELMVMPHTDSPGGTLWIPGGNFTKVFSGTDSALGTYNVYTVDYGWTGIVVQPTGGADKLSGTIDIGAIIKGLIWNGVVTGNEYVSGIEFGAEVDQGSGSMTVNALNYVWTSKANTTGTSGNDTFTITTPGGNHVVSNGGTDTVVYATTYTQNQLKVDGSSLLVMQTGNYKTLDDLQGISAIKFSDGTYNVSTHSFTPGASGGGSGPPSDTTPPAKPTIAGFSPDTGTVGDGITTANALTLTGGAEANSTVKVYDGTTLLGSATANASGAWSYTTSALANATHSFTATATDAAGNASAASASLSVVITAPANAASLITNGGFETDDFTGWTLGGNSGSSQWGPQTSIDANAHGAQFAANLGPVGSDGTMTQSVQTTAGTHYMLDFWLANGGGGPDDFTAKWNGQSVLALTNSPAQGYTEYKFDVVGAAGSSTLEFDFRQDPSHWSLDDVSLTPVGGQSSPPPSIAPVITAYATDSGVAGDGITKDPTLTLAGTAAANSAVKVFDGTTLLGTTNANASGVWSFVTGILSDATHHLTATTSGGTSSALAVTVDTIAPGAPVISSDAVTNGDHVTLTGTAEANSTVTLLDGGTKAGGVAADGTGHWTYTSAALDSGVHSFAATAMDAAGNTSATSSAVTETIAAAQDFAVAITSFGVGSDGTSSVAGNSEANSSVSVYDGNTLTLLGTTQAAADGTWSLDIGNIANTVHSFTAAATDSAGHTGATMSVAIFGTSGSDTMVGSPADEVFTGGRGTDVFAFSDHTGNDVITDFRSAGWHHDVMQFGLDTFSSYADIMSHATQAGTNVVITLDANDTVTLANTTLANLHSNDFHLV